MSDYSSKKVAELKELLSARGLAVSGNKADLVARLEEADKAIPAETAAAAAEATAATEAAVEETTPAVTATSSSAPAAAAPEVIEVEAEKDSEPAATTTTSTSAAEPITVEDDVEEEPVVEISDEDKQKQAIEDLEKQIKRKKRFATGDNDADIADLEKQLERIKRFGVSAVPSNGLSLDKGLDTMAKGRRKEGGAGKVRRESVTSKDKTAAGAHPYKKSENGLKPGVKIATVDEEKIKARQARFSQ